MFNLIGKDVNSLYFLKIDCFGLSINTQALQFSALLIKPNHLSLSFISNAKKL